MLLIFEGDIEKYEKGRIVLEAATKVIAANNGIPTINDALGCVMSFYKEYLDKYCIEAVPKLYILWTDEPFQPVTEKTEIAKIIDPFGRFLLIPDNDILTVNIKEGPDGEVTEEPTSEEE